MIEERSNEPRLECGHCKAMFVGTASQAKHVKYEKKVVYCSKICRDSSLRNKFSTPIPNRGPCKTCKKEFFSRTAKIYCCLECYVKSDQFKEMTRKNFDLSEESRSRKAEKARKGKDIPCLECGVEFYAKPSGNGRSASKFCGKPCYRAYWAKRYDRWIANPEGISLPQCYDEFLDKEELPCLIEGCDWKGIHLTIHMNQAHGVKAKEFKRAAGFNYSTGVIGKNLAEALRAREVVGVAKNPIKGALELSHIALAGSSEHYRSKEGKEHAIKARTMLGSGPKRSCLGCNTLFTQRTPMGRAMYCSIECREKSYSNARKRKTAENPMKRLRNEDGTFKWVASSEVQSGQ